MSESEHKFNLEKMLDGFEARCRKHGLKLTPQRIAIYKALISTDSHPTADEVCQKVREEISNISLDTVNRTLLTLTEIGAAFQVEGTGQPRRFDGGLEDHQHFLCIKCGRVIDFKHDALGNIHIPDELQGKFQILRKTVYLEGFCNECAEKEV